MSAERYEQLVFESVLEQTPVVESPEILEQAAPRTDLGELCLQGALLVPSEHIASGLRKKEYSAIYDAAIREVDELRMQLEAEKNDGLTGLMQRKQLMTSLERAIVRQESLHQQIANPDFEARRRVEAEIGLSLMFIDLDKFKQVNDNLGHDVGDEVLIGVSGVLEECVRPTDSVARIGGDEFVVVLTDGIDEVDAKLVKDRIETAIGEMKTREWVGLVGASIGMVRHAPGMGAVRMMKEADEKMYAIKAMNHALIEQGENTSPYSKIAKLATGLATEMGYDDFIPGDDPVAELTIRHIRGLSLYRTDLGDAAGIDLNHPLI